MKIRTAIFGIYVVASAIGLAVLMRFVLAEVRPRYVNSIRTTLQQTADLAAGLLETRWPNEPRSDDELRLTLADELMALERTRPWLRVRLWSSAGHMIFDSMAPPALDGPYPRGLVRQSDTTTDTKPEDTQLAEIGAFADIFTQGRVKARVQVSRPIRGINDFIWSERKKLAGLAIVIAAAMVALGWWISARLTAALVRLTAYAQRVRDGHKAQPPVSKLSEITHLGESFEEMRQALEGKAYVERYTEALTHELKAPLSAIKGTAELLQERNMAPEQQHKFLRNLETESERIRQIIDAMLQLSALEARQGLRDAEPLDWATLVMEAVDTLEHMAIERQVTLATEIDATAQVLGEHFWLRQAVINLVQNALSFSPPGSTVTVTTSVEEKQVCVHVTDAGPGLPDYALDKVFERFYSLPRPDTGRKSSGLGLSFVREIAELHGGSAALANRPEGGAQATFRVKRKVS